jgi:hypothetical protein
MIKQEFELVLKNEKRRLYNRMTLFILILNFIFFIYGAIAANQRAERKWFIFCVVVILLNVFITWYRNTHYSLLTTHHSLYSGTYVAVIFSWILLKNYWLAGAHLILLLLYLSANRNKIIRFMAAYIYLPGMPEKKIEWQNVSHVVLKDGILTLDFKNNKLLQAPILESWTMEEEQAFNTFCYDQINISAHTTS